MFEKYIRSNGNDGVIHKLLKGNFDLIHSNIWFTQSQ
jgi:hypothetical protein